MMEKYQHPYRNRLAVSGLNDYLGDSPGDSCGKPSCKYTFAIYITHNRNLYIAYFVIYKLQLCHLYITFAI